MPKPILHIADILRRVDSSHERAGRWPKQTSGPVHYQEVFASLYRNLGIDAYRTTITDPTGRPHYLLQRSKVMRELI